MAIKRALAAAALVLTALLVSGCTEPLTMYQVPESGKYYASDKKILVMPFMDTRTFVPASDPHTPDLGNYARSIFVAAMREHDASGADILTPAMAQPTRSMTNAEVAEVGRRHGADVVVSGQVFSFTDTRAASIPPRAGMFVRVIAAADGSLLFTGDHYQAASYPMAGGGRDLQAKNVSSRLVEGFMSAANPLADTVAMVIASHTALAMPVAPDAADGEALGNLDGEELALDDLGPVPEPPPLPDLANGDLLNPEEWDDQLIPEVPPLLDAIGDDLYALTLPTLPEQAPDAAAPETPEDEITEITETAEATGQGATVAEPAAPAPEPAGSAAAENVLAAADMPTPLPPPPLEELGLTEDEVATVVAPAEPEPAAAVAAAALPEAEESAAPEQGVASAARPTPVVVDTDAAAVIDELPELDLGAVDPNMIPADAVYPPPMEAAKLTGDELAADLFESDGDIWEKETAAPAENAPPVVRPAEFDAPIMPAPIVVPEAENTAEGPVSETAGATASHLALAPDTTEVLKPFTFTEPVVAPVVSAAMVGVDGAIVSMPLAVEQPRTVKSVDMELAADPTAVVQEDGPLVSVPPRTGGPIRVLILPYHDRENENNLIANTGGGEVVTTLYGTQLALDPQIQIMWDGTGQATHHRLISREEAIEMGRLAGADYVVRGQVVEFRRAQSVPSFYSAVISTAVLAAQMFFAEMSGVDVATEVYRVSDGMCVMSRRDRAQQKYVVQAEKTVRRMALGMADSVAAVIRAGEPEAMDPLIDELTVATVLSNPK
ncbi:MAG: hypothetical protein LUE17_16930 [Planctomycetaceae bacterium]|nr:hypothetical protein [Planctomycetaceae bacterium]